MAQDKYIRFDWAMKEGRAEGAKSKALEIAQNKKAAGMSAEQILQMTGILL